jgi:hypothetical protein
MSITRREFLQRVQIAVLAAAAAPLANPASLSADGARPVVSIVKRQNGDTTSAV